VEPADAPDYAYGAVAIAVGLDTVVAVWLTGLLPDSVEELVEVVLIVGEKSLLTVELPVWLSVCVTVPKVGVTPLVPVGLTPPLNDCVSTLEPMIVVVELTVFDTVDGPVALATWVRSIVTDGVAV
jgi:hypothetical protein